MRFTTIAAVVVCAINASVVAGAAVKGKKANPSASPVTVSGCLERDDDVYRLTDTGGAQAPKERSWKTAFIRHRNTDLEVVDVSRRVRLKDHVGHRVSVTGSVRDGEIRVASVRHLAASCGQ